VQQSNGINPMERRELFRNSYSKDEKNANHKIKSKESTYVMENIGSSCSNWL